ncbi:MAG: hypothetical protein MK066_13795 [Crocinitomicaceae bacterium]|nr:hypothetical protein [Crocinitomicaceae bacterium]
MSTLWPPFSLPFACPVSWGANTRWTANVRGFLPTHITPQNKFAIFRQTLGCIDMRTCFYILIISLNSICYGQNFNFSYVTFGLGSNMEDPPELAIKIDNDSLTYFLFEPKEGYYFGRYNRDSMYLADRIKHTVHFRKGTIDSIITLVDTLKGKKVINTNSSVRSGSSQQIFISKNNWCTEFSLTNTFDTTAMRIVELINCYLPSTNQIWIPYSRWEIDRRPKPMLKECNGMSSNSSYQLYLNEGEQIKNYDE